jgi:hypothetical protein
MAKVTGGLFSVSASGQFAQTVVFDKRGRARQYVVPANPQTAGQMTVRNRLGDFQRCLKLIGTKIRGELKSGFGATWNARIVGELTANDASAWTAYLAEFNAFQAGEKTAWAGSDTSAPSTLTDGAVLYACASAVYDMAARMGVTVTLTQPSNSNNATVAGEWTAAAA